MKIVVFASMKFHKIKINKRYKKILNKFKKAKILIIGDFILDRYTICNAIGKTAKTPTLSVKKLYSNEFFGGASLFLNNIISLGAHAELITIIGDDYGKKFINSNIKLKKKINYIIDKKRPTTIKERFMVDGYKLLQLDILDNKEVTFDIVKKIKSTVIKKINKFDCILFSDSRHGMLSKKVIEEISIIAKKMKKKVIVDTQVSNRKGNLDDYKNIDLISVNDSEARDYLNDFHSDDKTIFANLCNKLNFETIIYKLGAKGLMAKNFENFYKFPALPINVIDPIGSGDAFLSCSAISKILNINFEDNIFISSCGAALCCTKLGTSPITIKELENFTKQKWDLNA